MIFFFINVSICIKALPVSEMIVNDRLSKRMKECLIPITWESSILL